jgi:hypothetical protein
MPSLEFSDLFDLGAAELPRVPMLIVRMAFATILGAFVAFRAWRPLVPFVSRPLLPSAQSQTLIAAAGAVMVVVIGDNPARAFGLVGLGSFIRFRSGINDPRDAAVMFVMIGIGMACGLGLYPLAIGATLFVAIVLTIFDHGSRRVTKPTKVTINADLASSVHKSVTGLFPGARLLELATNAPELGKDSGKLVFELDMSSGMDAGTLREMLDKHAVSGVRRVAVARDD